jgi:uncharacterized damage-inducible protein DinB
MNSRDLILSGLAKVNVQVERVFEAMPPEIWNARLSDEAMTPLETLEHLCHVIFAFSTEVATGEPFDWDTEFATGMKDPVELWDRFVADRARAVTMVSGSSDDEVFARAFDYLILHEAYHVGQMAQLRITMEPDWNPYSLYE